MTFRSLSIPAFALLLLTGVGAERVVLHVPPAQADAHHRKVESALANAPPRVGDWLSDEAEPPAWLKNLDVPHTASVRRYVDVAGGDSATVVLIHCRDARDILAFDPKQTWAGDGWTVLTDRPMQWRVGQQTVCGTVLALIRSAGEGGCEVQTVCSLFLTPGETWFADAAGVESTGAHYTRRYFGADHVQIILEGSPASLRRDAAVQTLLNAYHLILTTIRSGAES